MKRAILLLLVLAASPLWAEEWHVRTDGNDTRCRGTEDAAFNSVRHRGPGNRCAFRNLQAAFTAAKRRDVITLHAGTYTLTVAAATTTCYSGLTCFALMPSKSGVGPIILRGERDIALATNDPNGLLSIVDGNNVINAAILSNIDQFEVRDIRFQNFIGDPALTACKEVAIVGVYGNDVKYVGNAHYNPNADAHGGERGDLALDGQRFLVRDLWMESGHPVLVSLGAIRTSVDTQTDSQNGIMEAANLARTRHKHMTGTAYGPLFGVLVRGLSRFIIRTSYYVDTVTAASDSQGTEEHRGIELRDSTLGDLFSNVVSDLQGTPYYYSTIDTRDAITEQHYFHNNTGHRIRTTSGATIFRMACNGCTIRNNLCVSDTATGSGMTCLASTTNTAGSNNTIAYTAMFNVNRTMSRAAGLIWRCPISFCMADTSDVLDVATLLSPNDLNRLGLPGWVASGGKPYPYYRAMADSVIAALGDAAACPTSCAGDCWYGAYGSNTACVPSPYTPFPR